MIDTDATYQFALDVTGGPAVFVAMDVYAADGTWFPELSISTAETGGFSSAAFLPAGEYYFQVKAVGSWRVTINPL